MRLVLVIMALLSITILSGVILLWRESTYILWALYVVPVGLLIAVLFMEEPEVDDPELWERMFRAEVDDDD